MNKQPKVIVNDNEDGSKPQKSLGRTLAQVLEKGREVKTKLKVCSLFFFFFLLLLSHEMLMSFLGKNVSCEIGCFCMISSYYIWF